MKKRKGFTLVELLVVIAILAIFATVSIVSYTSFTRKASLSNDEVVINEMNRLMTYHEQLGDKNKYPYQAVKQAYDGGFSFTELQATTTGYHFAYDAQYNCFVLLTDKYEFYYGPETHTNPKKVEEQHKLFVIVDNEKDLKELTEKYYFSVYLNEGFSYNNDDHEINVHAGIDTGLLTDVKKVTYDNSEGTFAQDVIVRTNGDTELVVKGYIGDTAIDDVNHYGDSGKQIISVGDASYYENGGSTFVELLKGHYVQNEDSIVCYIDIEASEGPANVELKSGSTTGTITNNNEEFPVVITNEEGSFVVNMEIRTGKGSIDIDFKESPEFANVVDQETVNKEHNDISIKGIGNKGKEGKSCPPSDVNCPNNSHSYREIEGSSIMVCEKCGGFRYIGMQVEKSGAVSEKETIVNFYKDNLDKDSTIRVFEETQIITHIHTYSEWEILIEVSCVNNGIKIRKCPCGASEQYVYEKSLGHDFVNHVCTRCNKQEGSSHIHDYKVVSTKDATCLDDGLITKECSCGSIVYETIDKLNHNMVDGECSRCHFVDPCKHKYEEYPQACKEATCTSTGLKVERCKMCGDLKYTVLKALGHKYKSGVCERCGEEDPSVQHSHNYQEVSRVEATCLTDGLVTSYCAGCKGYKYEVLNRLGHNFVDSVCTRCGYELHNECTHNYERYDLACVQPSCLSDGLLAEKCTKCNQIKYTVVSKLGHKYVDHICERCGDAEEVIHYHEYVVIERENPTCVKDGLLTKKCSCGDITYEVLNKLGHDYVEGICSRCGDEENPACQHTYEKYATLCEDPTCVKDGLYVEKCSKCNDIKYTVVKKLGHNYVDGTCSRCGEKDPGYIIHTHSYEVYKEEKATCEDDGYVIKKCSCGELSYETVSKLNHDMKEIKNVAPTCEQKGEIVKKCSRCTKSETQELKALGHKWPEWTKTIQTHSRVCLNDSNHKESGDHIVDETGKCTVCEYQCVISVNNAGSFTFVATMEDAIKASENGAIITIYADINENFNTASGVHVTLNLNGHKLTVSQGIEVNDDFILTDTANGELISTQSGNKPVFIMKNSNDTLTLKKGKVTGRTLISGGSLLVEEDSTAIVNCDNIFSSSVFSNRELKGGYYKTDPKNYAYTGYSPKLESGLYHITRDSVSEDKSVAVTKDDKTTYYKTLYEAVYYAPTGALITVNNDLVETKDIVIPAEKSLTLNINGRYIKLDDGKNIKAEGKLVMVEENNTNGKIYGFGKTTGLIEVTGTLDLKGGCVQSNSETNPTIKSSGTTNILDGKVIGTLGFEGTGVNIPADSNVIIDTVKLFPTQENPSGCYILGGRYVYDPYNYLDADHTTNYVDEYFVIVSKSVKELDATVQVKNGSTVTLYKDLYDAIAAANKMSGTPEVTLLADQKAHNLTIETKMYIYLGTYTLENDGVGADDVIFIINHAGQSNAMGTQISGGVIEANGKVVVSINMKKASKDGKAVLKKIKIKRTKKNENLSVELSEFFEELECEFLEYSDSYKPRVVVNITEGTYSFDPQFYIPGYTKSQKYKGNKSSIYVGDYKIYYHNVNGYTVTLNPQGIKINVGQTYNYDPQQYIDGYTTTQEYLQANNYIITIGDYMVVRSGTAGSYRYYVHDVITSGTYDYDPQLYIPGYSQAQTYTYTDSVIKVGNYYVSRNGSSYTVVEADGTTFPTGTFTYDPQAEMPSYSKAQSINDLWTVIFVGNYQIEKQDTNKYVVTAKRSEKVKSGTYNFDPQEFVEGFSAIQNYVNDKVMVGEIEITRSKTTNGDYRYKVVDPNEKLGVGIYNFDPQSRLEGYTKAETYTLDSQVIVVGKYFVHKKSASSYEVTLHSSKKLPIGNYKFNPQAYADNSLNISLNTGEYMRAGEYFIKKYENNVYSVSENMVAGTYRNNPTTTTIASGKSMISGNYTVSYDGSVYTVTEGIIVGTYINKPVSNEIADGFTIIYAEGKYFITNNAGVYTIKEKNNDNIAVGKYYENPFDGNNNPTEVITVYNNLFIKYENNNFVVVEKSDANIKAATFLNNPTSATIGDYQTGIVGNWFVYRDGNNYTVRAKSDANITAGTYLAKPYAASVSTDVVIVTNNSGTFYITNASGIYTVKKASDFTLIAGTYNARPISSSITSGYVTKQGSWYIKNDNGTYTVSADMLTGKYASNPTSISISNGEIGINDAIVVKESSGVYTISLRSSYTLESGKTYVGKPVSDVSNTEGYVVKSGSYYVKTVETGKYYVSTSLLEGTYTANPTSTSLNEGYVVKSNNLYVKHDGSTYVVTSAMPTGTYTSNPSGKSLSDGYETKYNNLFVKCTGSTYVVTTDIQPGKFKGEDPSGYIDANDKDNYTITKSGNVYTLSIKLTAKDITKISLSSSSVSLKQNGTSDITISTNPEGLTGSYVLDGQTLSGGKYTVNGVEFTISGSTISVKALNNEDAEFSVTVKESTSGKTATLSVKVTKQTETEEPKAKDVKVTVIATTTKNGKTTTYTATIGVESAGYKKVEYSTDNKNWTVGTSTSNTSGFVTLYVRVTDANNFIHVFECTCTQNKKDYTYTVVEQKQ